VKKHSLIVNGKTLYFMRGKEVSKATFDASFNTTPPDYAAGECPSVRPDMNDFSLERDPKTGKRGRYFPQLADAFESVGAASAEAKRRGFNVSDGSGSD
jgi:hypothetical protein